MIKQTIKKSTSLLLALVLLLCAMSGTAFAVSVGDFADVKSSSWYYDYVSYVVDEGLYLGTSADSFSPNQAMTRGMFITVLGRYAGVDPEAWLAGSVNASDVNLRRGAGTGYGSIRKLAKGTALTILDKSSDWYKVKVGDEEGYIYASYISPKYHSFSDVSYKSYYAGYAIWAFENEYISGDGSNSVFSPNSSITREQICRILNNYAQKKGYSLPEKSEKIEFKDAGSISSWATEAVSRLQRSAVITGEADGSGGYNFRPGNGATRAEVAKMLHCFVDATGAAPQDKPQAPPEGGEEEEDPVVTPPAQPSVSDHTAPIVDTKISGTVRRVKAALYVSTKVENSQVSSVTLLNTGSGGFAYGTIDDNREFVSEGTLSSNTLKVTTDGTTFTLKDDSGSTVLTRSGTFALRAAGEKTLTRVDGGKRYYGDFEFRHAYNASGKITLINVVDMDDYIKGVLPYEVSASWPAETLKAVAIATRSYTQSYCDQKTYAAYGFDIVANNGAQTYKGRDESKSESSFAGSDAAVEATSNMFLTYNGAVCNCTYFSSSGGATESAKNIWGTDHGYLKGRVDPYEASASGDIGSYYIATITQSRLGSTMNELASAYGLGTLAADGIQVNTYEETGNVESVVLTDTSGESHTIRGESRTGFLLKAGHKYTSYRYTVSYDSSSDKFTITRYGWGHNVGMSQWGAYAMGKYHSMNFQDILGFYYAGTEIRYGA